MAAPVRVRVRYFNLARELAGRTDETVVLERDATVGGLLRVLSTTHSPASTTHSPTFSSFIWSAEGMVSSQVRLFLNDRALHDLRLDEALAEDDVVLIFSAVSGG